MDVRGSVRGYNHNFRYRGAILHIQSEASAAGVPRVTTQLFMGGTVLATRKSPIEPGVELESVMKAQHKDVLRELCGGSLDDRLRRLLGPEAFSSEVINDPPSLATTSTESEAETERAPIDEEPGAVREAVDDHGPAENVRLEEAVYPVPSRHRALPSYRHSIRRRGLLLGVRTIDLGVERAEIVTELFHGNNVLAIRRTTYERYESDALVVRRMQEQHKATLHKVRRGGFDPRLPIFSGEPLHASR